MKLSEQQVQRYMDDGFLVVENVFSAEELRPVMDWFDTLVDDCAERLHAAGKIEDKHEGEDTYTRLWSLEQQWPGAAAFVTQRNSMGPALASLWCSDKLLDMVEQFLGPDVVGHPISIFRSKTPDTALMTVPWHQDAGYFLEGGEDTLQPTAWIPFIDATQENGTLQIIRGSHKFRTVFPHRIEKDIGHPKSWYLYIADADLPPGDRVVCEMPMGSVLWHQNMIVHRSTENFVGQGALDLRSALPAARRAHRLPRRDRAAAHAQGRRSRLRARLVRLDRPRGGGQPELPPAHGRQLRVLGA